MKEVGGARTMISIGTPPTPVSSRVDAAGYIPAASTAEGPENWPENFLVKV